MERVATTRPTVLLIGGASRSGSTLLECMLDQADGVVAIGEITYLWGRALGAGERCGCGEQFGACPFWSEVGRRAFGGWERLDASRVQRAQAMLVGHRYVPWLVRPSLAPRFGRRLRWYAEVLERLYAAIADVAGARVIVDASKLPPHGLLLRHLRNVDLRVVQLVRDPRAVAHSWTRTRHRPQAQGSQSNTVMRRRRAEYSGAHWIAFNLETELIARLGAPSRLLHYEQLVQQPRPAVRSVLEHAGIDPDGIDLSFVGEDRVALSPGHGLAGNPVRFKHGDTALRLDEEWRRQMPPAQQLVVRAMTAPLEARYRRRAEPLEAEHELVPS